MKRILIALFAVFTLASSACAHWADLAVAEISTFDRSVRMNLTFATQSVTPGVRHTLQSPASGETGAGVVSVAAALAIRRDNNEQRSILGIPADG